MSENDNHDPMVIEDETPEAAEQTGEPARWGAQSFMAAFTRPRVTRTASGGPTGST